jgi:hypothetical protein
MILILDKVWLVNLTTGEMMGLGSDPSRSWNGHVDGAVRKYAGGRQRAVGSVGLANTWKITLVEMTQAQCEKLETWMGQGVTVFVRDARGQSLYATFFAVDRGENFGVYPYVTYDCSIEYGRVDVVEGV